MQFLEQAITLAPLFVDPVVLNAGSDEAKVLVVQRAILNAHIAIKGALELEQKSRT